MDIIKLKQWTGPILAILYILCICMYFTGPLGSNIFDMILMSFVMLVLLPLMLFMRVLLPLISFRLLFYSYFYIIPLLLLLVVIWIIYQKYKRDRFTTYVFIVSFFCSGVNWIPSQYLYPPGLAIDYVLFFFLIVPGTTFYVFVTRPVFLISIAVLSILSIITMEFVYLVTTRKMPSHQVAPFLLLVAIIWSFVPATILIIDPYVSSVLPFPIGPIHALFLLPLIDWHHLKLKRQKDYSKIHLTEQSYQD